MPILKPISGHTSCQNIQRYLEKGGRALAHDFFNLSWDEREDDDDEELKSDVRWADEMDETRRLAGNDMPFGGLQARTYKHFVLSPSPEDDIDLAALRELACAWTLKHFGEYQVAIVYHDDNEGRIPHAHIVVNNTNLETGRRLQTRFPLELNRDLQEMARDRDLRFLTDDPEPKEGLERLAAIQHGRKPRPKTMQQMHIGRAESELVSAGAYSWVADIRNRVSVAKSLARSKDEFTQILGMLGVDVTDNSRSAKRNDLIYSLADVPTRRVSGERLGLLFAKETVLRQLARASHGHPDARTSKEILRNARDAVLVNDLVELDELSSALRTCAYHGVSSIQEGTHKLASLRRRIERTGGRERDALMLKAAELEVATDYMESHNLLPVRISSSRSSASTKQPVIQAGKPHSEQRERSRATEQSREPAQDRSER